MGWPPTTFLLISAHWVAGIIGMNHYTWTFDESLRSFKYRIISSSKTDNLTFSFTISIPFISFSYLIALAKNFKHFWIIVLIEDILVTFLIL
jgi:hypothetical protein